VTFQLRTWGDFPLFFSFPDFLISSSIGVFFPFPCSIFPKCHLWGIGTSPPWMSLPHSPCQSICSDRLFPWRRFLDFSLLLLRPPFILYSNGLTHFFLFSLVDFFKTPLCHGGCNRSVSASLHTRQSFSFQFSRGKNPDDVFSNRPVFWVPPRLRRCTFLVTRFLRFFLAVMWSP